jgi:hypothetical protein
MVNLKALEAAINQVETIRDHEFTFEIDDKRITLRPLRSHEETEIQRYAQEAWEGMDEDGDTAAYQEFMDRVRLSTLGFSVVEIGDLDLRGVEWLETDEIDENGNVVSVPKWEAVRDLIRDQWTKALALQVFAKFGELLERVEISASKLVKFDPSDLDEEIERVEKRLEGLKKKRDQRANPEVKQTNVQKAQKAVVEVDQQHQQVRENLQERLSRSQEQSVQPGPSQEAPEPPSEPPRAAPPQPPRRAREPSEAPQGAQGRRSSVPQQAQPPERAPDPSPQEARDEQGRAEAGQDQPKAEPVVDRQGIELPHDGDSFFDPSDPEAAIEAETRRQAALHAHNLRRQRERKMQQQRAEAMGMPSEAEMARERQRAQQESSRPRGATRLDPRTANLRQAANLSDQMFDAGAGRQQSARPHPQPQPGGPAKPATLHGKPVYQMPTQTLDKPSRDQVQREHGEPAPSPIQINPTVGARQSKFRGPGEQ